MIHKQHTVLIIMYNVIKDIFMFLFFNVYLYTLNEIYS